MFYLFIYFIGKRFIYWNGVEPRMCLVETELIKELLYKHSTKSGKSWLQQQGNKHFIGRGLLMANGENWHHQRHIVAPAFMGERLKVYSQFCLDKSLYIRYNVVPKILTSCTFLFNGINLLAKFLSTSLNLDSLRFSNFKRYNQ